MVPFAVVSYSVWRKSSKYFAMRKTAVKQYTRPVYNRGNLLPLRAAAPRLNLHSPAEDDLVFGVAELNHLRRSWRDPNWRTGRPELGLNTCLLLWVVSRAGSPLCVVQAAATLLFQDRKLSRVAAARESRRRGST